MDLFFRAIAGLAGVVIAVILTKLGEPLIASSPVWVVITALFTAAIVWLVTASHANKPPH